MQKSLTPLENWQKSDEHQCGINEYNTNKAQQSIIFTWKQLAWKRLYSRLLGVWFCLCSLKKTDAWDNRTCAANVGDNWQFLTIGVRARVRGIFVKVIFVRGALGVGHVACTWRGALKTQDTMKGVTFCFIHIFLKPMSETLAMTAVCLSCNLVTAMYLIEQPAWSTNALNANLDLARNGWLTTVLEVLSGSSLNRYFRAFWLAFITCTPGYKGYEHFSNHLAAACQWRCTPRVVADHCHHIRRLLTTFRVGFLRVLDLWFPGICMHDLPRTVYNLQVASTREPFAAKLESYDAS